VCVNQSVEETETARRQHKDGSNCYQVFVGRYPAMMHANCKEWIAALGEVERMTAKTVVPGHGSMSTMEDVVR